MFSDYERRKTTDISDKWLTKAYFQFSMKDFLAFVVEIAFLSFVLDALQSYFSYFYYIFTAFLRSYVEYVRDDISKPKTRKNARRGPCT